MKKECTATIMIVAGSMRGGHSDFCKWKSAAIQFVCHRWFLSSHFSASHFPPAPSATLRVSPSSWREAFTANVVTLVLLYFRTSRPLLRPLPVLALLVRPPTHFPPAPSVTLRVSPSSRREAFTANVVMLVLLYCRQFCFRTSRPRLRPLPVLALLVRLPHTSRLLPSSRYACHLPPGGRRKSNGSYVFPAVSYKETRRM